MTLFIAALGARLILFAVFALAGVAKLSNLDMSREMLAEFGVRGRSLAIGAVGLPLVELAIATMLIVPQAAFAGALSGAVVLTGFSVAIAVNLAQGRHPSCNCFGLLGSSPIGPTTLARNVILTSLAVLVVAAGPDTAATWRLDLVFGLTPWAALVGVAAAIGLLLLMLILVLQLAILDRLAQLPGERQAASSTRVLPGRSRGLPEGTLAPRFGLGDTRGDFVTLDQLLAPKRPVILLFTKPDCPPCAAMSSEVDRWQAIHADQLEIVRIGEGLADVEQYSLLQVNGDLAAAYDCWGTPCAVLVMPDGTIGGPAAQGAAAIRALVKRTVAAAALASVRSA